MSYHLFSARWVNARKPHGCIWCGGRVERGDVYRREKSIYDGNHQNFSWHWDCWFDAKVNYFDHGETEFSTDYERPAMLPFRSMEVPCDASSRSTGE